MGNTVFIKILSISAIILLAFRLSAQTVNTGELVIVPGTQVSTLGDFDNKASGDVINDGEFFIYGNFHNDGLVSFSPGQTTGLTRFEGMYGRQTISGEMPSEFFGILLDNPASQPAFALPADIHIYGEAAFRDGIVDGDTHGGLVTFHPGAFHREVSDNSFVDGQVRKTGDEGFDFPVGDGGYYRRASMTSPTLVSDHFTSQYILENSNTLYPHDKKQERILQIDDTEYWEIDRTAGNSDIVLSLTWHDNTTPGEILREEPGSDIHIVRWDAANNLWIDEGGTVNREEMTVTAPVTGYGIFTFAKVREEEEPDSGLVIYNGISPNGDGRNDFFYIKGIENYPDNTVEIYNRWGVKVYDVRGYNNTNVRFEGYSQGRATVNKNRLLPTGTYFYILKYRDGDRQMRDRSGYLYIN